MSSDYRPDVIPAICDNGHTFYPSAYRLTTGGMVVKYTPSRTGTCPQCGAKGIIAAGCYKSIDGAVRRTGDADAEVT